MKTDAQKIELLIDRISKIELLLMSKKYHLLSLENKLGAYQTAINSIDDFFEYSNESISDREKIHEILATLTTNLAAICNQTN